MARNAVNKVTALPWCEIHHNPHFSYVSTSWDGWPVPSAIPVISRMNVAASAPLVLTGSSNNCLPGSESVVVPVWKLPLHSQEMLSDFCRQFRRLHSSRAMVNGLHCMGQVQPCIFVPPIPSPYLYVQPFPTPGALFPLLPSFFVPSSPITLFNLSPRDPL